MTTLFRTCIALLAFAGCGWTQVAAEANKNYQTPEGRQGLIKTLGSSDREQRMKPKELVGLLGLQPGMTVADVGTGAGMMLPYLSEAVGASGRVIAQDIQQDFLDKAKERAQSRGLTNVTFLHGTDRNPSLPEAQVDLIFTLDAYHHFDYPAEMLAHFARALKPGGRLAVADFYRFRRGPEGKDQRNHVRADKDEVIREIESNGYELVSQHDHLTNQYVAIFRRKN
jgi:ubiquinone/menaquinone biosynthesis C-methylase UbiE